MSFNTRFRSHLVSFHKVYNFTCDLLFSFWISELKNADRHVEKYHKKLPNEWLLERKHFCFLITPSCFNKQKCRYEKTFKERNHLA